MLGGSGNHIYCVYIFIYLTFFFFLELVLFGVFFFAHSPIEYE